jgi:hypothetical protein
MPHFFKRHDARADGRPKRKRVFAVRLAGRIIPPSRQDSLERRRRIVSFEKVWHSAVLPWKGSFDEVATALKDIEKQLQPATAAVERRKAELDALVAKYGPEAVETVTP